MTTEGAPATGAGRDDAAASQDEPPTFDTSVAHVARVYDYWLGGKDNYAADRAAGDAVIEVYPDILSAVQANRAFLARVVRYLVAETGIRQLLDIGTGIPTANNTHEVAQSLAPDCRVVYVDYDPVVLAHARALLTSTPQGATDYIDADVRDTDKILDLAAQTLDFSRPVGIMLISILHLIEDDDDPYQMVAKLMEVTAPGSYLALSHVASDVVPEAAAEVRSRLNRLMYQKGTYRSHAKVARFLDGLEIVEPGVVQVQEWRPASEAEAKTPSSMWGGVGRKR